MRLGVESSRRSLEFPWHAEFIKNTHSSDGDTERNHGRLAHRPGALSRVSQLLGGERINMLAMSIDPSGHLRMVVDNPLHAANTLREQHYNVDERDVLLP
jgi:hypothetical protein